MLWCRLYVPINISCTTLAFAESSVDRQWDTVIFSDESTFSLANDGPAFVYRPWGEHYNSKYMLTSTHSGCVSVHY
jgi:hypothetical protein